MKEKPILYIVIPCYNEEAVLPETNPMFLGKLHELMEKGMVSEDSRIMYANDGSKDRTWDLIEEYAQDPHIVGISQSRNRGHQSTVLAGMMEAKDLADIVITIDCDGQDDIMTWLKPTKMEQKWFMVSVKNGLQILFLSDLLLKGFTI